MPLCGNKPIQSKQIKIPKADTKEIPTELKAEMQVEGYVQINVLNADPWHRIMQGYKATQDMVSYLPSLHFHLWSLKHACKQNTDIPCIVNV